MNIKSIYQYINLLIYESLTISFSFDLFLIPRDLFVSWSSDNDKSYNFISITFQNIIKWRDERKYETIIIDYLFNLSYFINIILLPLILILLIVLRKFVEVVKFDYSMKRFVVSINNQTIYKLKDKNYFIFHKYYQIIQFNTISFSLFSFSSLISLISLLKIS